MQLRTPERHPVDRLDAGEPVEGAIRYDGDAAAHPALGIDVEKVQPEDVEDEAQRQRDAVIGKASEREPDEHQAVARERRRKNHVAPADAGVGLDRKPRPESNDDRDDVSGQRVEARLLDEGSRQDRSAKQPRDQRAEYKRADELEAAAGEKGYAGGRLSALVGRSLQPRLPSRVHSSPVHATTRPTALPPD